MKNDIFTGHKKRTTAILLAWITCLCTVYGQDPGTLLPKDPDFVDPHVWVSGHPLAVQPAQLMPGGGKSLQGNGTSQAQAAAVAAALTGDTFEDPIIAGTFGATATYSNTQNTNNFTNAYTGRPTKDVVYRFTITRRMSVTLSHCGSVVGDTYLTLLDANGAFIDSNDDEYGEGKCPNGGHSRLNVTLDAGTYHVVSEGYSANGNITTNITVTAPEDIPGNTFQNPFNAGSYSTNFTYTDSRNVLNFSDEYGNDTHRDFYHKFTLTKRMGVVISHCGSNMGGTQLWLLNSGGNLIDENDGNWGPIACSQSSQAILKLTLDAGTYYAVSSAITWEDVVALNITGHDPGLIAGNTLQNPVDAGTYSAGFTYSDTRNTLDYTDEYTSRPMADVFHKFKITTPMEVTITHCGSETTESYLWLLDSEGNLIDYNDYYYGTGRCSSTGNPYLKRALAAGTYYAVSEGKDAYHEGPVTVNITGVTTGISIIPGGITPAAQTVAPDGSVTLTHSGSTGVTARQWQLSTNNGSTWTDISGATAATYNTGALTNNGTSDITQKYRVKINGQALYSAESVITVSGREEEDDDDPAHGDFTLVTKYQYDHAGRLTVVTQDIGSGEVTVAENEYNELGQLVKTKLHEKADNNWLETVNYEYNIRGWVTGIDAGYFKERLHYQDAVTGLGNTPQWAGNISAMEWNAHTVDNKWHAYAYTYDNLSRLEAGLYKRSTVQGAGYGTAGNNLYNENYTYDVMGNTESLNRWLDGEHIDQLTFIPDGNRTGRITDTQSSLGFAGSSNYGYDAAGRLKSDSQKGITKVDYNHMSLPQYVIKGSDSLKYTYDATGRRIRRQYKTEKARCYIDGAEYEGNRLKFIATPYGRIRKAGDAWHYDYFLKDHLGNVRVVLTADPNNQEVYTASMEVGASPNPSQGGETAAYESQYFANLDETRADKPYNYPDHNPLNRKVAKVPGKSRGPSITLKVMAGDTVEISAKAFYNIDNTLPGKGVDIAPIVGSAIAAMTSPVGAVLDEAAQLALDLGAEASQSVALVGLPKEDKDEYQNPQPKSGINFVAYNEKFKVVPENTGVLMVEDNIHTIQTLATDRIIIRESGFLEVYAHNEAQTPVYFDNMTVSRRAGAALEVNAYYPYGMLNPGLSSSNGDAPNAYKYNAKELQKELNLNWLDYGARMMDPAVSRWWVPDPLAEKYYSYSPYAYCGNNPIMFFDPNGMEYTDYYNLNGKKVLHVDDGRDDRRMVLTTSNKENDVATAINDGNVVDIPSNKVVSTMEKVFDKTEETGSEHYFRVGNNGTISRVVEGEPGKVSSDAIMSTTKDLTDVGDLVAYDVHSHTPPSKKGTTTIFGEAKPSDTDLNNIVGSRPNVVLGYKGFNIPPPSGQIGGTSTVGTVRQIGFFNSNGQIGQPVDFSQYKRAVTRINK